MDPADDMFPAIDADVERMRAETRERVERLAAASTPYPEFALAHFIARALRAREAWLAANPNAGRSGYARMQAPYDDGKARTHNDASELDLIGRITALGQPDSSGAIDYTTTFVLPPGKLFAMPTPVEDALDNLRTGVFFRVDPRTGNRTKELRGRVYDVEANVMPMPAVDAAGAFIGVYDNVWCVRLHC